LQGFFVLTSPEFTQNRVSFAESLVNTAFVVLKQVSQNCFLDLVHVRAAKKE
jgi:hypothetical protein